MVCCHKDEWKVLLHWHEETNALAMRLDSYKRFEYLKGFDIVCLQ